jgi:hypothetical protein
MLAGMVFAIAEITLNVERIVWLLEGGEDGEGAPEEEDA